jgi:hypothetical protein
LARVTWLVASSTRSAFVRKLQNERATLLLDEGDAFLGENQEFRNALDAASDPDTAVVALSVKQGDNWVPTDINIFVPITIASIGKLRGMATVEDRSIHIWLKRATKAEQKSLTKARRRTLKAALEPIADQCARWALDNADKLAGMGMDPALDLESARAEDNWSSLVAIADYLDGNTGQKVRTIAGTMTGIDAEDGNSLPILLLADIKDLFDLKRDQQPNAEDVDKFWSKTLCEKLATLEDRPWKGLAAGKGREPKPIDQQRLANMLRPFQIEPRTIRVGKDRLKGYQRKDFEDAWLRYPAPKKQDIDQDENQEKNVPTAISDDFSRDTVTTIGGVGESAHSAPVTEESCHASKNGTNPNAEKDCHGVTGKNTICGGGSEKEGGYQVTDEETDPAVSDPPPPPHGRHREKF